MKSRNSIKFVGLFSLIISLVAYSGEGDKEVVNFGRVKYKLFFGNSTPFEVKLVPAETSLSGGINLQKSNKEISIQPKVKFNEFDPTFDFVAEPLGTSIGISNIDLYNIYEWKVLIQDQEIGRIMLGNEGKWLFMGSIAEDNYDNEAEVRNFDGFSTLIKQGQNPHLYLSTFSRKFDRYLKHDLPNHW